MSIADELRNIRDHLRSGRFGQREVWERQLEKAADEIERLRAALDRAADALEFYDNKAEAQKARRALEAK